MAPPVDPPASITLRVKVPPGHVPGGADEFTLGSDIPVVSKVGQIRERIQEAIPSSPTPERQRLLYGGRALVDNDQTVADALNIRRDPTQTEYVIHLLVKGEGAGTAPVPHRTGMPTPARSGSPAAATQVANGPPPPAPAPQPAQAPNVAAIPDHILQERMRQDVLRQHTQRIRQHEMQHQAAITQQMQQQMMQFQQPPGFVPQQMLPFPMHNLAGHLPGMPFPQAHGFPMQPGLVQRQQHVVHGNEEHLQHPNLAPQNTSEQQSTAQNPEGGSDQSNQGQTSIQLPTRTSTHMTPQGHDVQVRIQSTLRIPNQNLDAQQRQLGTAGVSQRVQAPGIASPQGGPSALDRARENVAEMRRLINEMRSVDHITEPQRAQIQSLEERTQSLNDYIDPFRVGNGGSIGNNRARSNSPNPNIRIPPHMRLPPMAPLGAQPNWQQRAQQIRQAQHQHPSTSSADVTCYLLSSPTGPHAILHSPQHGVYTGSMLQPASTGLQATPTTATPNARTHVPEPNQQVVQGQAPVVQQVQAQAQAQAAQPDQLGPLGPIMGHVWLLIRVLIFSYFLLGANMGWRRPLALFAIGMGFWMIRMGLLGDGGALRRWWDGLMNDGRARPAQQQGQQGQDQNRQEENQQQRPAAGNARPGHMPTPEQLAQRLLDEDARARDQARDQRVQWLRERVRPVERAVALLVASLWPGVGEAYVRAREQEERQRAEEEIAARRREEEERQKAEEEEKQKADEGAQSDDKNAVPLDTALEASAAGASNAAESGVAADSEKTGGAA